MTWKELKDKKKFKQIANKICSLDEARYSLLYGMILNEEFGKHRMLHHEDLSIAIQSGPSRPLVISDIGDLKSARELAIYLESSDIKEIVGTKETINMILDNIRSSEAGLPALIMDQTIFTLSKLEKTEFKYRTRLANPKDLPLVIDWFYQFMLDTFVMESTTKDQVVNMAQTRINNEEVYLLMKDGNPVSMVCSNRPTTNGITINGLYSPIENRGYGHATELLASVSELLLKDYNFCCLYADLNNTSSTKIYTRLGYKPVCDSLHYKIKN